MAWKNDVIHVIQTNWKIGDIFTINDIYEFEQYFSNIYRENEHVKDKLRQILQFLRDDGILEFINSNGTYRRIG